MAEVTITAHQTRICRQCDILWAVGRMTRAKGPENYHCDSCLRLTELYAGTHLVVVR